MSIPSFLTRRKGTYTEPGRGIRLSTLFFLLGMSVAVLFSSCALPGNTPPELSGSFTVAGSTALSPLALDAAKLFMQQHPKVKITVQAIGSIKGLQAVTNKKADIGTSDIYADPADYPDPNLTDHIVCVVPFTMIVHPGINIASLTSQQIIDIFSTAKYRNWNQLNGPDLPIVPVVRPTTSGTRDTFRKYVLGGRDEFYKPLDSDSSAAVLEKVASTPGAIGYLALSFVNKQKVQTIALNDQQPKIDSIANGTYSFWSYEHMYTLGDDNPAVKSYLDFMLSPRVQKLAESKGYISIDRMVLKTKQKAFIDPALPTLSHTAYHESETRRYALT